MSLARLIAALAGTLAMAATASAATVETPYEEPIQYALENLTSGISTTATVRGIDVSIKPVRTWKSVSGHYCRRYEITIAEPGAPVFEGEGTRCREKSGGWKAVEGD
jgi:surface antigen